jgi:hypothetical protein
MLSERRDQMSSFIELNELAVSDEAYPYAVGFSVVAIDVSMIAKVEKYSIWYKNKDTRPVIIDVSKISLKDESRIFTLESYEEVRDKLGIDTTLNSSLTNLAHISDN